MVRSLPSYLLVSAVLAGCGASVSSAPQGAAADASTVDGSTVDAGVATADDAGTPVVDVPVDTAPFVMADHTPYPVLPDNGGPRLLHPQIVTVTYADDPNAQRDEDLDTYLVASHWLSVVGADYGVSNGTILGNVRLPAPAPTMLTSIQLETNLVRAINAGTIPSPPGGDFSNVLYMLYFPSQTVITDPTGTGRRAQTSCMSYAGYHSAVDSGSTHLAYTVIPDCGDNGHLDDASGIEVAASHELIEAATDAFPLSRPSFTLSLADQQAWGLLSGGEVGDLCDQHNVRVDGHLLQRVWSNSAAAANLDPCIPAASATPALEAGIGFNVSTPDNVVSGAAGDTITVDVTGWSSAPVDDWQMTLIPRPYNLAATLDHTTINNNRHATLTIHLPATATPGRQLGVVILSVRGTQSASWPIAIELQ